MLKFWEDIARQYNGSSNLATRDTYPGESYGSGLLQVLNSNALIRKIPSTQGNVRNLSPFFIMLDSNAYTHIRNALIVRMRSLYSCLLQHAVVVTRADVEIKLPMLSWLHIVTPRPQNKSARVRARTAHVSQLRVHMTAPCPSVQRGVLWSSGFFREHRC